MGGQIRVTERIQPYASLKLDLAVSDDNDDTHDTDSDNFLATVEAGLRYYFSEEIDLGKC
jgi:hypothetical protein